MSKKKTAKKIPAKPVKKVAVKKAPAKPVKKAPPAKAAPTKKPAPAKTPTIEIIKPADSHIYQGMEGIVTKAHKAAVNALLSMLYLFVPKDTKLATEIHLYGRRLELMRIRPDKVTEPMVAYVIDEITYFTPSSDEPDPSTGLRPGLGGIRSRKNAEDLGVLTAAEEFLTVYDGTAEGRSAAINKLTQLIKPKVVTVETGTTRLPVAKANPATPLKEALQRIIAARDHYAENSEYPEDLGIDADRCFDDWAADLAQEAIDRSIGMEKTANRW